MDDIVVAMLSTAAEGLVYSSETDAPFTVFTWDGPGDCSGEALANRTGDVVTRTMTVEAFFAPMLTFGEGSSRRVRRRAARYASLCLLLQNLQGATVVFVGRDVVKKVYVFGQTRTGSWIGVETESVET